jgi:hypothetical protein
LLAVAIALLAALSPSNTSAQEPRDPLIDPASGEPHSRFQIVGQAGWTPGAPVTLHVGYTTREPLSYPGPFSFEQDVTVLRDGTWSFPIVLNEQVLGEPLPAEPGYVVVRAESGEHIAQNAYVYTIDGARPSGADAIAPLGFGSSLPGAAPAGIVALLMLGGGGLVFASGALRRAQL